MTKANTVPDKLGKRFFRSNTIFKCQEEVLKDRYLFNEQTLGRKYLHYLNFTDFVVDVINAAYDYLCIRGKDPFQLPEYNSFTQKSEYDFIYAAIRLNLSLTKHNFPEFNDNSRKSWSLNYGRHNDIINRYYELSEYLKEHKAMPSFNSLISSSLTMLFIKIFNGWIGISPDSLHSKTIVKFEGHTETKIPSKRLPQSPQLNGMPRTNLSFMLQHFLQDEALSSLIYEIFFKDDTKNSLQHSFDKFNSDNPEDTEYYDRIIKETMSRLFSKIISKYLKSQTIELQKLLNSSNEIDCSEIVVSNINSISYPLELNIMLPDTGHKTNLANIKALATELFNFPVKINIVYK
ncbi:MAG: hypothetical protein C0602_06025 [Denitrovibrio sp.]|nr:MAG: hypothetical protein C0602_06025 [Denitrovibrio sp.]